MCGEGAKVSSAPSMKSEWSNKPHRSAAGSTGGSALERAKSVTPSTVAHRTRFVGFISEDNDEGVALVQRKSSIQSAVSENIAASSSHASQSGTMRVNGSLIKPSRSIEEMLKMNRFQVPQKNLR